MTNLNLITIVFKSTKQKLKSQSSYGFKTCKTRKRLRSLCNVLQKVCKAFHNLKRKHPQILSAQIIVLKKKRNNWLQMKLRCDKTQKKYLNVVDLQPEMKLIF